MTSKNLFVPCCHRWSIVKKTFKDRFNWLTVQRCRRCGVIEQTEYRIEDKNERMQTYSHTSVVIETGKQTNLDAITEVNNSPTVNNEMSK